MSIIRNKEADSMVDSQRSHSWAALLFFCSSLLVSLFFIGCQTSTEKRKLNINNWANYIGKTTIADFEKESGIQVTYDNFSSNEELYAKLKAGAQGYDLIVPSDYMVDIMRREAMLQPLDKSSLSNFKNLDNQFLNKPFDPDNQFCVPYHWGTVALGVNKSKIKEINPTWDMLWNEAYKGKIATLDDPREGFIPVLKKLGYSLNTTNPEEIAAAKEWLLKQKPLIHSYTSDMYVDLLKSEEVWLVAGYSGDILQAQKENPNIALILPQEGSEMSIDHFCIPKGAPHIKEAHEFLNYILRKEIAASIANDIRYATCNEAAKELIDSSLLSDKGIYPPAEAVRKHEFLQDIGEAQALYDKAWAEVKAG